ncbi:hypothetical protein [Nostoc sp. 106C]|nr:hypothetical protein [Nostoc sp. 106C]
MNHIQPPSIQFTCGLLSKALTIIAIATSVIASSIPMAQANSCRTVAKD